MKAEDEHLFETQGAPLQMYGGLRAVPPPMLGLQPAR